MRGDRLKQLRQLRGHTQESLSEMVGLGNKQIWRYESETTYPDGETIALLAQALETSTDYLLGLTDDPAPPTERDALTPREQVTLSLWRRGQVLDAIRLMVGSEAVDEEVSSGA